jgi:hypothetical protein
MIQTRPPSFSETSTTHAAVWVIRIPVIGILARLWRVNFGFRYFDFGFVVALSPDRNDASMSLGNFSWP